MVAALALYLERSVSVPAARVVRTDVEQHVVATGRVWVPTRLQVAAQNQGLVVAVGAVEGQHIKAGTLLVQIDDSEARAVVAQWKAAVDQASARVEQLKRVGAIVANEGLKQAETNLERAQADLDTAGKLASSGAATQLEVDNARRAFEVARAQKTAAQAQQVSSAPMGADSRVALTALLQAQAQLAGANVRLAQTKLIARQDGVILSRTVEPGDVAQPGRTLLTMAVEGDLELVFHPDERNLATLALGQKARVSADAFPEQVVDAAVSYIAPSIDAQRGSVEVRLSVHEAPKAWKPDMTVSIDLTVARKPKTLALDARVVRSAASEAPFVFGVENGRVVKRVIKLGIRGENVFEIASGLDEGAVALYGPALKVGERIRTTELE